MKATDAIASFDRYQLSLSEARLYRGWRAEMDVADWLRSHGLKVRHRLSVGRPFDLICEGKRIEVKVSKRIERTARWCFQLHHSLHRKIDETQRHFYILRAEDVPPTGEAIHFSCTGSNWETARICVAGANANWNVVEVCEQHHSPEKPAEYPSSPQKGN